MTPDLSGLANITISTLNYELPTNYTKNFV
jgi:hypothetical protein